MRLIVNCIKVTVKSKKLMAFGMISFLYNIYVGLIMYQLGQWACEVSE